MKVSEEAGYSPKTNQTISGVVGGPFRYYRLVPLGLSTQSPFPASLHLFGCQGYARCKQANKRLGQVSSLP